MKPSLIILAAGLASRYGAAKQIEGFGLHNELIVEYSIYDAIYAGFGEVVFVIRKELLDFFQTNVEPKIKDKIIIKYAFQEFNIGIGTFIKNPERVKPWGTAHAVLCCKDIVHNPFAVINADDFYGRDSFIKAYNYLQNIQDSEACIIGYELDKTLSENGTVSRGVCEIDNNFNLINITERLKIYKNKEQNIVYEENLETYPLNKDTFVSMNFFCFNMAFFKIAATEFHHFLALKSNELKSEFYLPMVVDKMIHNYNFNCKVIPCREQWYGVTYKEDAQILRIGIKQMIIENKYPEHLW